MRSPEEQKVIDDFARLWWADKSIFFHQRWLGLPTLQHPFDMWVTQEIIVDTQPDLVIEAGSFFGGSAVLWASLLEQLGDGEGRVVAIDLDDNMDAARKVDIFRRKVDFLQGSTVDPGVLETVRARAEGKRTMVILDSAHDAPHVLDELRAYGPLVSPGCYLLVQDGFVNGHPCDPEHGPGPFEAIHTYLAESSDFEIDSSRERMLFTFNPDGFLLRNG